jgi:acetyl-CoA acetyltransferase
MGLELEWFAQADAGPSQLSGLFQACEVVQLGLARHVIAVHASTEGSARARMGAGGVLPGTAAGMPSRISGLQSWALPFGAVSVGHYVAMYARRHFHEYGITREQLAAIALVQRKNAGLNPDGIYRDPMTLEEYLGARMVMDPLCLFDCDIPIDFGVAIIVSRPDAASASRHDPVLVEAISTVCRSRSSWDQFDDLTTMMLRDVGSDIWTRTSLQRADVDVAGIYDGFSWLVLAWLEALGFCGRGESGAYVEGGHRIALDGELPINTGGGQLSAGRMHGWGYVVEICRQLWGEGGDRQVPGDPAVGLVAAGGGPYAGAMLLRRSGR